MTELSTKKPLMLSFQELPWTNQLVVSSETKEKRSKVCFVLFLMPSILFSILRKLCAILYYLNLANINLRLYHLAPFLKYRIHRSFLCKEHLPFQNKKQKCCFWLVNKFAYSCEPYRLLKHQSNTPQFLF